SALKQAPDMDDAIANRKAVDDWLKRQNEQQQNQDKKDHQGNPQDNKSQSPDQSSPQKGDKSDQQKDENKDGQQGDQSQQQKDNAQQKNADANKGESGKQDDSDANDKQGEKPGQPQPSAEQQEALRKQIDQALAKPGKDDDKGEPAKLATAEPDTATQEQQQAMKQWLERVPDDPGGLLRRKFMLEYQRKLQGEGGSQ
ncbi:MAG: hypothetical protein ABI451_02555, partial [Dokdonella sp.]